jgi:heterodisulfide reductase subunit C/quinone-modifying oxidoreductase subunit QmoC
MAVHIFGYLEFDLTTHYLYALHLAIAVPMLIIEIPFGKWSHMIYRPLAIYFETVKEKALQKQSAKEESLDHAV